jgi:hypothetical protein
VCVHVCVRECVSEIIMLVERVGVGWGGTNTGVGNRAVDGCIRGYMRVCMRVYTWRYHAFTQCEVIYTFVYYGSLSASDMAG